MGRARHAKTWQRMDGIYAIAVERQPITIRGIAYQFFMQGVIPSMETTHVALASRVEASIRDSLDTEAWERYQATEQAEHASMLAFFRQYSIVHQGSP
jgi:hypothetical protein